MSGYVFLFPGQGSQYIGMGNDIDERYSSISGSLWNKAAAVLGFNLKDKVFNSTEEELKDTAVLQPAIFTLSAIICEVLKEKGIVPKAAAGHSLGEYAALYCAGVYNFEVGIKIVSFRGKVMQEAAVNNPGAMAAILGMEFEELKEACASVLMQTKGVLSPANFNSPSQIVISGDKPSVKQFIAMYSEKAKKIVELPVAGAFHSFLMKSAADKLSDYLKEIEFKAPQISLFQNIDGKSEKDAGKIKERLIAQTTGCVMWTALVNNLVSENFTSAVECGPGKVIKGLVRQISSGLKVESADTVDLIEKIGRSE